MEIPNQDPKFRRTDRALHDSRCCRGTGAISHRVFVIACQRCASPIARTGLAFAASADASLRLPVACKRQKRCGLLRICRLPPARARRRRRGTRRYQAGAAAAADSRCRAEVRPAAQAVWWLRLWASSASQATLRLQLGPVGGLGLTLIIINIPVPSIAD